MIVFIEEKGQTLRRSHCDIRTHTHESLGAQKSDSESDEGAAALAPTGLAELRLEEGPPGGRCCFPFAHEGAVCDGGGGLVCECSTACLVLVFTRVCEKLCAQEADEPVCVSDST